MKTHHQLEVKQENQCYYLIHWGWVVIKYCRQQRDSNISEMEICWDFRLEFGDRLETHLKCDICSFQQNLTACGLGCYQVLTVTEASATATSEKWKREISGEKIKFQISFKQNLKTWVGSGCYQVLTTARAEAKSEKWNLATCWNCHSGQNTVTGLLHWVIIKWSDDYETSRVETSKRCLIANEQMKAEKNFIYSFGIAGDANGEKFCLLGEFFGWSCP